VHEFDAETLAFALDGDTVQNLVLVAAERWGMPPEEVLRRVGVAVTRGEIRLYIDDDGVERDVEVAGLTPSVLARQVYTWMTRTPRPRNPAPPLEQAGRQADD